MSQATIWEKYSWAVLKALSETVSAGLTTSGKLMAFQVHLQKHATGPICMLCFLMLHSGFSQYSVTSLQWWHSIMVIICANTWLQPCICHSEMLLYHLQFDFSCGDQRLGISALILAVTSCNSTLEWSPLQDMARRTLLQRWTVG